MGGYATARHAKVFPKDDEPVITLLLTQVWVWISHLFITVFLARLSPTLKGTQGN